MQSHRRRGGSLPSTSRNLTSAWSARAAYGRKLCHRFGMGLAAGLVFLLGSAGVAGARGNRPPSLTTTAASNVASTTATLNGTVNPEGQAATYSFQYGTTTSYGSTTTVTSAGSGRNTQAENAGISSLAASTTYHFRIVSTNRNGSSDGSDQTFTTTSGQLEPVQPDGIPGTWGTPIFDDEFNGTSLNTSLWSTGEDGYPGITAGSNSYELECYDPNQVSVAGGYLTLSLIAKQETCGGQTEPYASGRISTMYEGTNLFQFAYGAMEARIYVDGSNGSIDDWPAFWASGPNWPTGGEIDVFEGLGGQACATFHWGTASDPLQTENCTTAFSPTPGWHTFGVNWEPGSITFYYDGAEFYQVTQGVTDLPMPIILDLAAAADNGPNSEVAPAQMQVDYVRVWASADTTYSFG